MYLPCFLNKDDDDECWQGSIWGIWGVEASPPPQKNKKKCPASPKKILSVIISVYIK